MTPMSLEAPLGIRHTMPERILPSRKGEIHSHGGYLVFVPTRGGAAGQRSLLVGRSGKIERVRAGSLSAEAYSTVGTNAACTWQTGTSIQLTSKDVSITGRKGWRDNLQRRCTQRVEETPGDQ